MFGRLVAWVADRIEGYRWGRYYKWSAWAADRTPKVPGMQVWDDNTPFTLFGQPMQIFVGTEEDKQQLLLALEYLHNMRETDTDYTAVNYLVHTYLHPELIRVKPWKEIEHERLAAAGD